MCIYIYIYIYIYEYFLRTADRPGLETSFNTVVAPV